MVGATVVELVVMTVVGAGVVGAGVVVAAGVVLEVVGATVVELVVMTVVGAGVVLELVGATVVELVVMTVVVGATVVELVVMTVVVLLDVGAAVVVVVCTCRLAAVDEVAAADVDDEDDVGAGVVLLVGATVVVGLEVVVVVGSCCVVVLDEVGAAVLVVGASLEVLVTSIKVRLTQGGAHEEQPHVSTVMDKVGACWPTSEFRIVNENLYSVPATVGKVGTRISVPLLCCQLPVVVIAVDSLPYVLNVA